MPEKDPQDPSTTSAAYDYSAPEWARVESVLGGTRAMRDAGDVLMPQHVNESTSAYQERLSRNVLFNVTEMTLDGWVGRPFSNGVQRNDALPEKVRSWLDDVDLQGNNDAVFFRQWFREGLAKRSCWVLVEFPRVPDEQDLGRQRSLADDRAEGSRPYLVRVAPENLIFVEKALVNGETQPVHARIREVTNERVGFAEVEVRRIREYNLRVDLETGQNYAAVTVWRYEPKAKGKLKWVVEEPEFRLGIDRIPLVEFEADSRKAPLQDLTELNISHWQSNSDQIMVLTAARFPMLASSGAVEADEVEIGPHQWLNTPEANGKWYYVEHTGKAIGTGRQDLLDLEERMAEYGAMFIKRRPGNETATARALDSAEATSPLQDVTLRFVDAMRFALWVMARWVGEEGSLPEESLVLTTDFGPEESDEPALRSLTEARKLRDLSRRKYLAELIRYGALEFEFDHEENERQLAVEEAAILERTRTEVGIERAAASGAQE